MRILHVDSSNTRHLEMVLTCQFHEIVVHFAESGDEAVSILVRDTYDCVVIAPGLDDFSGTELVRRLRTCKVRVPVLLLGSDTTPDERARALWDGADDVMDLPWHRNEMVARMKALARRAHGHVHSVLKLGPILVDQEQMRVSIINGVGDSQVVHMTEKEYLILELLTIRAGRVCTKEQIMGHLYGGLDEPEEKIVDVFVCKLRRKLRERLPQGSPDVVSTVWGRGYMAKWTEDAVSPANAA
jgi:two-component system, cell cycle response regulator CtrA